jgi:ABC-type branched-subunit amino acid transport system substrate-binding protein
MIKIILVFLLIFGCSSSKVKKGEEVVIDNPEFLAAIELVKKSYTDGDLTGALSKLNSMNEQKLPPMEKAVRRNLMGVIFFSQGNYEKAAFNFEVASANAGENKTFSSQIFLNLGSSYYKMGFMERAMKALSSCEFNYLNAKEFNNFHKLRYDISKRLGQEEISFASLIYLLSLEKDLNSLRNNNQFALLKDGFFKWDLNRQADFLTKFPNKENLAASYLAYLMAEKAFYSEDRKKGEELLIFVRSQYGSYSEINALIEKISENTQREEEMDPESIGFVLPLSGKKAEFGKRVLLGLGSSIKGFKENFTVNISDSQGSASVGAFRVRELVQKNKCAAIVGGLFSDEATEEYLEAKKYGVFFISLSPIYLPKEEKDFLLLEIPGSIESQIHQLFKPEMLKRFGNHAAIFYQKGGLGSSYANEFWRKAKEANVEVTGIVSYDESDYLKGMENLLGIGFKRERQEELDFLTQIYSQEKSSTRRVQTLGPQVDFDWIFIPSSPNEALKIVPTFSYLDATSLNIIGGPAWRSGTLTQESKRLGALYFVGDNIESSMDSYSEKFFQLYNKKPKLLEIEAFDAMEIVSNILIKQGAKSRSQLKELLLKSQTLKGLSGKWALTDGIWLKEMASFAIEKENIGNLFEEKSFN